MNIDINKNQISANIADLLWYWFVNIKTVGLNTREKLLSFFGNPLAVYQAGEKDLSLILEEKQMKSFLRSRNLDSVREDMERLAKTNTRFIHWESPDYPARLRHLPDPPYGLYLRGCLPDPNRPCLAMIGSRKATPYGRRIAEQFAFSLAGYGIQIISGLAEGIDSCSHRGALQGNGYTLGVLGGGIDSMYPRENFNLYMSMYERGGVLSEWNLGVPNHSGLFPLRNRLISGLSDAVFVLEAGKRSGTFITVDQALEQGRTVFALPGRVTDVNSMGTNQLICDGAIPVSCPEDIVEYLVSGGFSLVRFSTDDSETDARSGGNNMSMTIEEQKVYNLIDEKDPIDYDGLLAASGYEMGKLSHLLFQLESSGNIYQPNQNVYLRSLTPVT
ncbi:MAG: DNA-processing protein DprA [Eubacterium sp.]|nr:DNA-processing protein DprA [Eubacterium sp.]